MKKSLFAAAVLLTSIALPSQAFDVEAKYSKTCATCHASGVAGAPKTGDAAAWKPRLDKGMDALLKTMNNGLNAMPPKGLCFDCSDENFKALIDFMAKAK